MIISKIFKELQRAEINQVISHLYGSDTHITACHLLEGGLFNTSYQVETDAESGAIILRAAPVNQHLLFDFERSMMSAEPLFYQLLQDHGIPSSAVIHYDNSFQVIEREYIIYRCIPSIQMDHPSVPVDVKPALNQQVGRLVALMHQIKLDHFGWERPQDDSNLFQTWSAFLIRFAGEIVERSANYGIFSDVELEKFMRIFKNRALFDQINQPRMVHSDLWEGNVLVQQNEDAWEVVALIDVDRTIFGDRALEFTSDWTLGNDFLGGYGFGLDHSPASKYRQGAYQMLWCFFYAYVWQVQLESEERFAAVRQAGLTTLNDLLKTDFVG
jgi:aminoglycoside phosphotransferase (APT) family kinase protein